MKRIMAWVTVFVLVVGGGIVAYWPVATWRLYDANWQPLALTQAESYCAGKILAQNSYSNKANDREVNECVAESRFDNSVPNVGKALRWACEGIRSADPSWSTADCLGTFENYQFWLMQHGGYTWNWNDQNPRPNAAYSNIREAPRGERNDNNRDTDGRFDY